MCPVMSLREPEVSGVSSTVSRTGLPSTLTLNSSPTASTSNTVGAAVFIATSLDASVVNSPATHFSSRATQLQSPAVAVENSCWTITR